MREGLPFGGEFCRRFHHVTDKPPMADKGAANFIGQHFGNAGTAMIR